MQLTSKETLFRACHQSFRQFPLCMHSGPVVFIMQRPLRLVDTQSPMNINNIRTKTLEKQMA